MDTTSHAGSRTTAPVPEKQQDRRTLSARAGYAVAAAVIGLGLFASVVPSPLYHTYSVLWHFSPVTLTLIYATYAFGVLASLLLAGRVSDQIGRRPTLLVALGALMSSSVLFMFADSTALLFVARGVQGLATGLALSAASAALLDLHPRRDSAGAGLTNGVVSAGGLGLGSLVSSLLVQYGSAPRVLPYVLLLVLFAVVFAGAYGMPEPVPADKRTKLRLTVQRPSVPAGIRHPFFLAGLAVVASWSMAGLFFSIGSGLSTQLFQTTDVVVGAIGGVVLGLAGALSQMVFSRATPWRGTSVGAVALSAGTVLIVVAAETGSGAALVTGCVVAGLGFGSAFLGGLRQLTAVIPPEHRAAVMSAFYIVAYSSLSIPAVVAGIVVTHLGLVQTFEIFGSVIAATALVVAVESFRTRPSRGA